MIKNKTKLRVAIYSGEIPSTTFIENLIERLAQAGINVYLFGTKKDKVSYSNSNIRIFATLYNPLLNGFVTFWRSVFLLIAYPKRFFFLFRQLSNYSNPYSKWQWWSRYVPVVLHLPDVFHVQWAKDLDKWLFLKDRFGVKIVLSLLGSHINYSPIADKALAKTYVDCFPKVDMFHAVSEAIALEAKKYNAQPDKITCIRTVLNSDLVKTFNAKKTINTPIRIVSIGRHHWVKGYDYALVAMGLLKDNNIAFQYDIIAQGDVSEKLLFLRDHLRLEDHVSFKKGMGQPELFLALKTYDILLLPSLSEGIANVVLEAMAIGVPVVSTNCGGMAEVVIPNKTGWLVPIRDAEALAGAIQNVVQTTQEDLQRITLQAHQFVKQHFNAEDSIAQFLELYERVKD